MAEQNNDDPADGNYRIINKWSNNRFSKQDVQSGVGGGQMDVE